MQLFYILLTIFFGFHVLVGVLLTIELVQWPKISISGRILYVLVVWLIPFFGALAGYKRVRLNWFKSPVNKHGSVGSGFLEMDSFFNPGARNTINAKDEVKIEIMQSKEDSDGKTSHKRFSIPSDHS
jgi:hypothetical protein